MSLPLRDVRRVAQQLVEHFIEHIAPCGALPGDALRGEVTIVTSHCLEYVVCTLEGRPYPERVTRLERAAADWAREGVPLDAILHALHVGFSIGLDLATAPGTRRRARSAEAGDFADLVTGIKLIMELLDTMTTAVTMAYVRELREVAAEHHTAAHTLTSALLSGHATSVMARESGIDIAARYFLLAVHIPAHPDEADPSIDADVVARRKLRRIQAELAARCGRKVLALLSVDGGTLLLPEYKFSHDDLDQLVAELSRAGQVPITAAVVAAERSDIPHAAEGAHQLLDTVTRFKSPGGLFRTNDMALEIQLSRPGPARDFLAAILDPLDEYPELMSTLKIHIGNELQRQRTATQLNVHANTVDYRLRRVAQLTGHDPASSSGLWKLRAALTARGHNSAVDSLSSRNL